MKLHDIFPPVSIVEYSLYYFIFFCILAGVLIWFGIKYNKKKSVKNRAYYLALLENDTWEDAKTAAYKLSYYSKFVARTDDHDAKLTRILTQLEKYKYEKNPAPLRKDLQSEIRVWLHALKTDDV